MDAEIKKMKNTEVLMSVLLVILLLLFVFVILFVVSNKNDYLIKEEVPVIDENNFVTLNYIDTTLFMDVYSSVNLKRVNFVNLSYDLVNQFYDRQDNIINLLNDNLSDYKNFIEDYNNINEQSFSIVNSKIDSIILFDLEDNILSLLYLIEEKNEYIGLNNYIANIFIDVRNNILFDNTMLLEKYNITKETVCSKALTRIINEHEGNFIDKDTNEEIEKNSILNNQNEYINILVDNFDTYFYLYFNNDSLYFKFNKNDISNFLFNEELDTIQYSTLKLDL